MNMIRAVDDNIETELSDSANEIERLANAMAVETTRYAQLYALMMINKAFDENTASSVPNKTP